MSREVIDVGLTEKDEEREKKSLNLEGYLEKNKLTVGFLLLGILLLGLGVLGQKSFKLWGEGARVEILGESEDGGQMTEDGRQMTDGERQKITVEVAGEVIKPGVYELEIGSRVNDLLITGGGLSANADREWVGKYINLAQKLQDGVKIFIPKKGGGGKLEVGSESGSGSEKWVKININTASLTELDTLWGIGEATAKKIIEARPFQKPEDLLEKKIIKSNVWEAIKDKITVY